MLSWTPEVGEKECIERENDVLTMAQTNHLDKNDANTDNVKLTLHKDNYDYEW